MLLWRNAHGITLSEDRLKIINHISPMYKVRKNNYLNIINVALSWVIFTLTMHVFFKSLTFIQWVYLFIWLHWVLVAACGI